MQLSPPGMCCLCNPNETKIMVVTTDNEYTQGRDYLIKVMPFLLRHFRVPSYLKGFSNKQHTVIPSEQSKSSRFQTNKVLYFVKTIISE